MSLQSTSGAASALAARAKSSNLFSWQTLFSTTLTTNSTGFGGWTTVCRIEPAATTGIAGGTKLRVRCVASTAADLNVVTWRIGHAAAAGDAYDFDGTQQPILRGGTFPQTIANTSFVCDEITYSYDPSKALLLALSFDTTSSLRRSGTITNTSSYQKNASNDANTTDKSGYSAATGMHCFDLIEIYAPV